MFGEVLIGNDGLAVVIPKGKGGLYLMDMTLEGDRTIKAQMKQAMLRSSKVLAKELWSMVCGCSRCNGK